MKLQRRLASDIAGCSPKKIVFDDSKLDEIKEAITKSDVRNLISNGSIVVLQQRGISRGRTNKNRGQKRKGRQKGLGSRKGRASARGENHKRIWINKVRLQRGFAASLINRNQIDRLTYKDLYRKIKGGFFRSKRHIELYLAEKGIVKGKQ
jgi:large subunit ribosomal protein L19e